MISTRNIFANPADLAVSLANDVASCLRAAIAEKGVAVLAVSGGTTPQKFFEALSQAKLDWAKVSVTLVDERQVDETSSRSNARLVKQRLMQNEAAKASFVPLYRDNAADKRSDTVPFELFDIAILGMGNDGHTASFFPGGDELEEALDPLSIVAALPMNAPSAGEPRITYTLQFLLKSLCLILHIQGQDKWATLEKALAGNDVLTMPVRAVLQSATPVQLYWCP
jgi:6-phosphogluconolactonase